MLIAAGVRWRWLGDPDHDLRWGDVAVLISTAPHDSPLVRAQRPKDWIWGDPHTDLLAGIHDTLERLTALHGNVSGVEKHDLPKPIPRPWDVQELSRKIGGKVVKPLADLAKWIESRQVKD